MTLTIDDFIAGWIGGMCGLVVGHPLDTIKVRQQTLATALLESIKRTFKYEGVRGFYRGMLFPLMVVGPSNAVFFGCYGNTMKLFERSEKQEHKISSSDSNSMARVYMAGCIAGLAQVFVTCPVEVIKTVLQASTGGTGHWRKHYEVSYTGSFDAFRGIIRDRGFRGLYRGCTTMMLRDVPTSGIYTLTYEMLLYSTFASHDTPLIVKQMIAGGVAGTMSWIPIFPIDVVKSRIQADNPNQPQYQGMIDCFYKSYKADGYRIFTKGFPALLMRAYLVNAATFVGYEIILGLAIK